MTMNSLSSLFIDQDKTTYSDQSASQTILTRDVWIQPSIIHLSFNASNASNLPLIDGVYVRDTPYDDVTVLELEWQPNIEAELEAMAADPEIQRENLLIQDEFSLTEFDGLHD